MGKAPAFKLGESKDSINEIQIHATRNAAGGSIPDSFPLEIRREIIVFFFFLFFPPVRRRLSLFFFPFYFFVAIPDVVVKLKYLMQRERRPASLIKFLVLK